jgi:hypothetical protein
VTARDWRISAFPDEHDQYLRLILQLFDLFMAAQKRLGNSRLPDLVIYPNSTRYSIRNRQREQT